MVLLLGAAVCIAAPFALRAGAEFFLPVTAALVISIALVPGLEWLERRGLPSPLAALICVVVFLLVINAAVAAIIVPATEWVSLLPKRLGRVRETLDPILRMYRDLQHFIDDTMASIARRDALHRRTVTVETPNSLLDIVTASAPAALIQMLFGLLVIFFFLSGWSRLRRAAITARGSFFSAMATARVIQEVVDDTSAYLSTITFVNIALGLSVACALWAFGMPSPFMWGGLVTILNYIPYLGPIGAAALLGLGGLMTYRDVWTAIVPPAMFVVIHLIEANIITPSLVGRRLTINPLLILVALSFWGWVWGTTGALLAVPLLIIMKTVIDAAGKPDIAGFLFGRGTLFADGLDVDGESSDEP
ncbi:AI-2E family transporter [Sphingomonas sp. ID0503]|uniref:AI-2E family transporter n=1 Tax=Sphingomonas sp. ID0503 TaxID=3399691 RepID=UPI003AFB4C92